MGVPLLLYHNQGKGVPIGGRDLTLSQTILKTEFNNLIGYWLLNELSGTNADNAEGTAARDGTYTGVTLGQVQSPFISPYFDAVNDYVDIYSASLAGVFSETAGTVIIFAKASATVWTDGAKNRILRIGVDNSNTLVLANEGNDNVLYRYSAGGTSEDITKTGMTGLTDWFMMGMTWDVPGNMTAYYNGAQEGTPQSIAGTWVGALNSTRTLIGASITTPLEVWDGYLAHCALWTKALTAAQILAIYQASGVA